MTARQYRQYDGSETTNIMAMNTTTAIRLKRQRRYDDHYDNKYGDGDIIRYGGKIVRRYDQYGGDDDILRYERTVNAYRGKISDRCLWRRSSNYAYGGKNAVAGRRNVKVFLGGAFASADVSQDTYQVVTPMEASIPSGYAYGGT
eukprot:CAMPEP_0172493936 /NCGR_PEP_ID=MMETSP1066-20121228/32816_1 /TAXON_ID=671091 /ORGANISM="Coscinodiscus wailesii, Strain CCMP2513" /LENGTH=144 /DNA_ID=CAMNT_0013264433 /DNA_START=481 /DNA_END=911 /DNA_ORIENTATION=+